VRSPQAKTLGKIYYECKRTKNYDKNWIAKMREDNIKENADILILVTDIMPENEPNFFCKDGVWICNFKELRGIVLTLRYSLEKVSEIAITNHGRETKMELLYSFLTSNEFKNQFSAILEGFRDLKKGYDDERLKMMKIWKQREKQLDNILINATEFYGSLKGIAGASIPNMPMLEHDEDAEIELLESGDED
jgi:hypothetical protein